ncbi:hypothetical protein CMK11_16220 [Candidatus Poribacteria bacterium]|nr:hypothetical protein [Candidatus Poribacteria bacterium]
MTDALVDSKGVCTSAEQADRLRDDMWTVLCMGDVHLENYGVMEAADGSSIWGLNDFDEAAFAPFSWDVKRGATSVVVAAREGGFSAEEAARLARRFADGYAGALRESKRRRRARCPMFTSSRGPRSIRKVIGKVARTDAGAWLTDQASVDSAGMRFVCTDEVRPVDGRSADFQRAIDDYGARLTDAEGNSPSKTEVLDVATKSGSGLGATGLWRYWTLVNVRWPTRTAKVVLELKQERPSVVAPYAGAGPLTFRSEDAPVAFAENAQLPAANPYYGHTTVDGQSHLVRRRGPHKAAVKLRKLKKY